MLYYLLNYNDKYFYIEKGTIEILRGTVNSSLIFISKEMLNRWYTSDESTNENPVYYLNKSDFYSLYKKK